MKTTFFLLLASCLPACAGDFATLCNDRAAIERVYYEHRSGQKPPFERALGQELLERLVRQDLNKEIVLKKVYGVEITQAMLDAEVQRINTSTRAPEVLAELKATLNDNTNRFAQTVARPIIVERLLRQKFDNDDSLHAVQQRLVEGVRAKLLAGDSLVGAQVVALKSKESASLSEITWQLDSTSGNGPDCTQLLGPNIQNSNSATTPDRLSYFTDLPDDLQTVLRAQLRNRGDISATIETPTAFLLYVAKAKTAKTLTVVALTAAKRSYEEWLDEQTESAN